MTFLIKRFHYLSKKNRRPSGRSSGFRGSSLRDKKGDQKGCFNCKKPGYFIADCPELQKDSLKKGSYQMDNFRNNVKKSIMTTWGKLDNEGESFIKYF